VARADDCRDVKDVAYIQNDICISYEVVRTSLHESSSTFLNHEVAALDRANWRSFSPSDFGFGRSVIGRVDSSGQDCLLLGAPKRTLIVMYGEDNSVGPAPRFWRPILSALAQARDLHKTVVGMQFYPGPATDPNHSGC
jgi:hypothetical protein